LDVTIIISVYYQSILSFFLPNHAPNLITYVNLEPAHCSDSEAALPAIHETQERRCAPTELLADAACGSDENMQDAAQEGTKLIAPTMGKPKKKDERLVPDDFETDASGEIVTCPAGERPKKTQVSGKGIDSAKFDAGKCRRCEFREYCEVGRGETGYRLQYTPKPLRLAKRRESEESEELREKYRRRSRIEATNAPLKRVLKMGRLRVRGLARVRHAVTLKALGWNFQQAIRARKA